MQTEAQSGRQASGQVGRDRQTLGHTDRNTDRQSGRHRQKRKRDIGRDKQADRQ